VCSFDHACMLLQHNVSHPSLSWLCTTRCLSWLHCCHLQVKMSPLGDKASITGMCYCCGRSPDAAPSLLTRPARPESHLQLGAQWLHGSSNNPVFAYATKNSIPVVKTGEGEDAVTFSAAGWCLTS